MRHPTVPFHAVAATAALAACAAWPPARADVEEQLRLESYPVRLGAGQSLLAALNQATPLLERKKAGGDENREEENAGAGGSRRRFHGYTAWDIRWQLRWQARPDGLCEPSHVKTRLTLTLTLPELLQSEEKADAADAAGRQRFARLVQALGVHEAGHLRIARAAARELDEALADLAPAAGCPALMARAHGLATRLLDAAAQRQRDYDRATRHGCTQGACLPAD